MKIFEKHYYKRGYRGKQLDIRIKENKRCIILNSIIILIFLIILFIPTYLFNEKILQEEVGDIIFNQYSNQMKYSEIIIDISNLCSQFDGEYNQIRCVNNFFKEFYVYDDDVHNSIFKLFQTPKKLINGGGVCRDATIFYKSIFESMGYKTEQIFEINHVYLKVYGEKFNYLIDQGNINLELED